MKTKNKFACVLSAKKKTKKKKILDECQYNQIIFYD